jgi:hypothetical protein
MTPEEVAFAEKARQKARDEKKQKLREDRAIKRELDAEEAAARPAPILVFDNEEDWSDVLWLIETRIPAEGAGMLFGETDVGKTFVSLNIGVCVSAGLPWDGQAVKQGTVLFIEAEGGRSFALRKHGAKVAAGLSGKPLFNQLPFITVYQSLGFGPDTTPEQAQGRAMTIREEAARHGCPPIRLVITDTLAQNMNGNVDSNDDMGAFLKAFRAFLKALSDEPVFGLLIHHPGHADKTRGRGAYALPADLDLIMQLEGTQDALTLSCTRMRDGERFAPIPLALEKRFVTTDDERYVSTLVVVPRGAGAAPSEMNVNRARIVDYLRLHPGKTTSQIAGDLHIGKHTVVENVDALVKDKVLERIDVKGKTGQTKQLYQVATIPGAVAEEMEASVAL